MPNPGAIHVASIVSGTSDFDVSGSLRSYAALVSVAGAMTTSFRPTIGVHMPIIMLVSVPTRVTWCTCAFEVAATFRAAATCPPLITVEDHW